MDYAADGQPTAFDTAFGPLPLLAWFAHARDRSVRGALGVALGACARCRAPLVVSSHLPVNLPCPHCHETRTGESASLLVDQWTEPWARVEGSGMSLEYRLALVDGQLAVRVDGTRDHRPWKALLPVMQGEQMLRTDSARGASADANRSILGLTGIGCAMAVGLFVLFVLAILMVIVFLR